MKLTFDVDMFHTKIVIGYTIYNVAVDKFF